MESRIRRFRFIMLLVSLIVEVVNGLWIHTIQ